MSSHAHFGGDRNRDPLEAVPTECYDAFRHPRRIRVLEVLGTHRTRRSLSALTTEIVDSEGVETSTGEARYDVRTSLVHNHLPRLAEHGMIEFDVETGAELVDGPPVHPADLAALLEMCDGEDGTRLLEALVHPVRMRIVSVLSAHEGAVSVDRVASTIADSDVGPSDPDRAAVSLHHSHLPRLADAGVLEYDTDAGIVSRPARPVPVRE